MPRCPVIIPLNVRQSRVFAVRSPANGNAADAGNRPSALAPLRPGLLDSRRIQPLAPLSEQELQWRDVRVGRSSFESCRFGNCCLIRSTSAPAAPALSWFRTSWHRLSLLLLLRRVNSIYPRKECTISTAVLKAGHAEILVAERAATVPVGGHFTSNPALFLCSRYQHLHFTGSRCSCSLTPCSAERFRERNGGSL